MTIIESAYEMAKEARKNSYSPYSKFKVGAAVILKNKNIYTGCNIENASFGATVCAERVAIWKAISIEPKSVFTDIVLITDPVAVPCAFCLQVFSEFCSPYFKIHLSDKQGIQECISFKELLPSPFNPDALPK